MSDPSSSRPFEGREPPPALAKRVQNTLSEAGWIEPRSQRLRRQAVRSLLVLAATVAAFLAGRAQRTGEGEAAPTSGSTFLMLLYEGGGYRDDRPVREIVAEYSRWADSLRRDGSLVLGEKLADSHAALPVTTSGPADIPTGLFIVRAIGIREATRLAESSPHLRHGGRILLSPIE